MAYTTLKPISVFKTNTPTSVLPANRKVAATTAGVAFYTSASDRKTLVELDNTASSADVTVVVKGSDRFERSLDMSIVVTKGTSALVQLDSAVFMNNDGTIALVPSAAISISVVELF